MERNLEMLKEEDGGRVSLETGIELDTTIEEADGSVTGADDDFATATRTALYLPRHVFRYLASVFLLEEFEFPPLVHLLESA